MAQRAAFYGWERKEEKKDCCFLGELLTIAALICESNFVKGIH